jgi:uridylate kinase
MNTKKNVLVKLTGEMLLAADQKTLDGGIVRSFARQIKQLSSSHRFSIVIGGGNFFRGKQQGPGLRMTVGTSHYVGMLATMMNGLILQDLFQQEGVACTIFSGIDCPIMGKPIAPQTIDQALTTDQCLIFTGGLGTPFFSTDTTAVVRALQVNAHEVWKATKVDGVYTDDPIKNSNAQLLKRVTFAHALSQGLAIVDAPALALAQEHDLILRVFSLFNDNALLNAAQDSNFGSSITNKD